MFQHLLNSLSRDFAIDLGTAHTHVYQRGKGIVSSQASFVAVHENGPKAGRIAAFGNDAKKLVGKTSANINCLAPLIGGAIQDFKLTQLMLKQFVNQIADRGQLIKGTIVIACPPHATEVERRALAEAAESVGARHVYLVNELLAACIGLGLNIEKPQGTLLLDVGAGGARLGVVALNGVVYSQTVSSGGHRLDTKICEYVRKYYGVMIGTQTAERAKIEVGAAIETPENPNFMIYGQGLDQCRPQSVKITQGDIAKAVNPVMHELVRMVRLALDNTPPEVSGDLMDSGLVLVGGGSQLRELDQFIQNEIGLSVSTVEDPSTCIAQGCGKILEDWEKYKHLLLAF